MNFYESASNIILGTRLWWSAPFIHTINLDMWERLPIDIQEGILRATETAQNEFANVYQDELENAIAIQEQAGATVKIADDEDIDIFIDEQLFERLRETWIKEAKKNHGIEDAERYVEELERIMSDALRNQSGT
jgi:TRAP-type C4-dicarboxylate transport system substrate-binding protein